MTAKGADVRNGMTAVVSVKHPDPRFEGQTKTKLDNQDANRATAKVTNDEAYYREEPYNNIDVVDRIGSGDAYVSGALYGYLKHKDCRKALEYGNAMAAIKHSVIGDMITTDLEEIDSIIAEHKNTGYHSEMNR
jgi:hypothetical protein